MKFFLAAYDPKLRRDQGVYYTPQPVIGVQVRLAAEFWKQIQQTAVIRRRRCVFLDPAAGTAAYPLAAAEYALRQSAERFGAGMFPARRQSVRRTFTHSRTWSARMPWRICALTQLITSYGRHTAGMKAFTFI